ncbi:tRNA pseudouridine(55) synthase TruB [Malacoplasma penetrans]|uniref:tRNA pseudouridine synthase B n=1 Tax=Malacoplasma penetrans (strain HF-2) TaxID=272633 RepID=TRUB_MALP2|nr:tRNA pseudouridine(55) synthase TruB [Malacoplasma penetrans]Q8CXQ2.1 RecName: Full=tRNA pseudouridine synthase B; AltName: Full=tRNA pseudouridine(55) synthase; Short=Psi55 synthase; AltName: Full=tRNA pseudouridylate synthase; AltName: Full=tRNA-uridine isomerase [Malacoplasma penetrans HF-2]RXY97129.1 tRNA pseudouridine(55) synthase TruB [Malacoplasma penetrans]BAC44715.1 tRNA pseudouridine 5S synthase [Malacoplasma penetrans HF-2]
MKQKYQYIKNTELDLKDKIFGINKPKNFSSNQVIQIIKKYYGLKKIGHAGTLDPLATGLLLVATNSKTKELNELILENKKYVAEIQFNYQTSTYDAEGEITNYTTRKIHEKTLKEELKFLNSTYWYQQPPVYSAVKIKGKKLYEYARANQEVSVPFKKVYINKVELISFDSISQKTFVSLDVSKGFYIRSFANDIGLRLNNYGYLLNLKRVEVGNYKLDQAYDFFDLVKQVN